MQSLKDGSLEKAKQLEEHLGKHLDTGKNFLAEFKKFATRGNVVDLAIGVIIGAAFGKIVSSLVADVIMPAVGLIAGKVDLKGLYYDFNHKVYASPEAAKAGGALTYGLFLQSVVDFLIVAFVIFVVVRQINKFTKPVASPTTRECPQCLSVIPINAKRCAHCAQPVEATTAV